MGLLSTSSTIQKPSDADPAPLTDIETIPIPQYQFAIEVDINNTSSATVALFQTASGISVTREVDPLKVGGENNFGREFPSNVSFGHITFGAGLTSNDFFWKWMMAGASEGRARALNFTLIQRRPNPNLTLKGMDYYTSDPDKGTEKLKDIREGLTNIFVVVKQWNFKNAFPVSWKLGDLSLDDSEKIAIESLELSFDYFELA